MNYFHISSIISNKNISQITGYMEHKVLFLWLPTYTDSLTKTKNTFKWWNRNKYIWLNANQNQYKTIRFDKEMTHNSLTAGFQDATPKMKRPLEAVTTQVVTIKTEFVLDCSKNINSESCRCSMCQWNHGFIVKNYLDQNSTFIQCENNRRKTKISFRWKYLSHIFL